MSSLTEPNVRATVPTDGATERHERYAELLSGRPWVVHLGAGNGELLDLLREGGIRAQGSELNARLVRAARERGHDVVHVDVLGYLRGRADASLPAAISTGLVDRVGADVLVELIRLLHDKIEPGGVLILEATDPRSASTLEALWREPPHYLPPSPDAITVFCRMAGFASAHLLPSDGEGPGGASAYTPGVYAVAAAKSEAGASAEEDHAANEHVVIDELGHRDFVGGLWEEIGRLQFDFLVDQGLRPEHVLVDIACGALRGGVHFIPYLERGHYLGLDKHEELVQRGIREELDERLLAEREPEFVIADDFAFDRFSKRPDFALAQSLFTHLSATDIKLCLRRLRDVAQPGCRFYATFFEADAPAVNPPSSASTLNFAYTRSEMEELGDNTGWASTYIGDWRHPRNQQMMLYTA